MFSCSEDKLSSDSVIGDGTDTIEKIELDTWIEENITKPYNIEVVYRWEKNTGSVGTYNYPPKSDNVKVVLEAVRELCFEIYSLNSVGGVDFLKGKTPLRLYLYGGEIFDMNGVELLSNPQLTPSEMCLYRVNDFNPADTNKVFALMRSVHHQFAKRLAELVPYDRDLFYQISARRYTNSTEPISIPLSYSRTAKSYFGLADYANKRGFYTMHSFISAEDDFAEIISSTLCSTPVELNNATIMAQTPDRDEDPEVQQRYNKEAEQAYSEFTAKQKFVNDYMKDKLHIDFNSFQITSVRRIDAYIKRHQ